MDRLISPFGAQVTIAQLWSGSDDSSRAGSAAQMPAKANRSPSGRLSQIGVLPPSSLRHS